ncbi:MAG: gamma-glutamylcyclotransferase [Clostridiaceae bacterium]|nr:gamma-glutamylcyclotransferase [Clostridiaceae bacterium]
MPSCKNELRSNKKNLDKVFVYGTLMKGFWNHRRHLDGRISRVTPGKVKGLLYHLPEGYPALLEGSETVKGEIVEPVDEELLEALDRLEGYREGRRNNLYIRSLGNVLTEDREEITCWVYFYADGEYARGNGIPVPNGDWREFMKNGRELI